MKKIFLIIALAAFTAAAAFTQEYKGKGRVVGYVYDEQNNPLEGVKIKFFYPKSNEGFDVLSEKDGKWTAAWIRGGGWNVDFEKFGFEPKKISLQVQEFQRNPEVKVNLKKASGLVITDELRGLLNEGNKLFEEKKYPEAAAAFQGIIEKFPDAYIIYKNIGNCYFQMEKYEEAETHYLKVLEKDPKNFDAMLLVGNTYQNRGQNEKALEWYGKIEFDKIEDPVVLYNVGTNYYNSSRFEEALRFYKKAVDIRKEFPDGLYQLGLAHINLGNTAEAVTVFESYLKLDADSARAGQVKGFLDYLKKK